MKALGGEPGAGSHRFGCGKGGASAQASISLCLILVALAEARDLALCCVHSSDRGSPLSSCLNPHPSRGVLFPVHTRSRTHLNTSFSTYEVKVMILRQKVVS